MSKKAIRTKTGRVLDQAALDKLTNEAQQGYDLNKVRPRPWVGRPKLGAGHGPSPRINVRLAPDVYRAVVLRARRDGRKVSEIAREAVEQFVAHRKMK
jgi:hypothetical protein